MLALARRSPRPLQALDVVSVTGGVFHADGHCERLNIGGVDFSNFGVAFADAPPFGRFGLSNVPALILGMSSLRLFRRVEIDFLNRQVAFSMPDLAVDFASTCRNSTGLCNSY